MDKRLRPPAGAVARVTALGCEDEHGAPAVLLAALGPAGDDNGFDAALAAPAAPGAACQFNPGVGPLPETDKGDGTPGDIGECEPNHGVPGCPGTALGVWGISWPGDLGPPAVPEEKEDEDNCWTKCVAR